MKLAGSLSARKLTSLLGMCLEAIIDLISYSKRALLCSTINARSNKDPALIRQQPGFIKFLDKQIKSKELGNTFIYLIFYKSHKSTFINSIS